MKQRTKQIVPLKHVTPNGIRVSIKGWPTTKGLTQIVKQLLGHAA